jgi:nitrite reductase/ring-hydroxylating ferredoxin subunit
MSHDQSDSQSESQAKSQSQSSTEPTAKSLLKNQPGLVKSSSHPMFATKEPEIMTWHTLCEESVIAEDGLYAFEIPQNTYQHPIVLINKAGVLYALHDECPHRRVKISSQGYVDDENIYCGFHHWGFKLETGAHLLPTGICVAHYQVRIENGQVQIKI